MSNVTALILLAGIGKRMKTLGKQTPKSLLVVKNKPILWYSINTLQKCGISKFIFVTGYKADKIISFSKKMFPKLSIKFIYNNKFNTTNSIYSYFLAREHVKNKDFLRLEGDLLYTPNIIKKILKQRKSPISVVQKKQKKTLEEFSVEVNAKNNTIIQYGKDISNKIAFGEAKGIEYISAEASIKVCASLSEYTPNHKNEYAEMAYQNLINQGKDIYFVETDTSDFWCEVDTEDDLKFAKKNFRKYL